MGLGHHEWAQRDQGGEVEVVEEEHHSRVVSGEEAVEINLGDLK